MLVDVGLFRRWCCGLTGGGGLRTNTETKGEAGDEHVPPGVCKSLPKTSQSRDNARNKDSSATAELLVHRVSEPAADEGAAKVRRRIDQANEPGIPGFSVASNAKFFLVKALSPVDNGFIFADG